MIYRAIKRIFDFVCALTALLVLSPLFLVIAVVIKLSSPGPVLFRTVRAGRDYKTFTVYKFRSMHVYDPNDAKADSSKEGTYIANSDRIFKFGSFLRKSKLDELPQLINILFSQMSVVGPRPVPEATARRNYAGKYACIMDVKPGLACLDSLFDYAHGELFVKDIEEYRTQVVPVRTELSRMYVEKQSLALDLYCIFRTVQLIVQIMLLKKRDYPYTKYEQEARENVLGTPAVK